MLQLNQSVLLQVLKDFYTLTKIRIVLWDSEFHEILCYPEERSSFCSLIRRDPQIDARCVDCDISGCRQCEQTHALVKYRCHAGLMEAVVPIRDRYGTIGYIFFGQVLPEEAQLDAKERLKKQFPEERFPGISDAISTILVKSEGELSATATILQALTAYVLENQWVKPRRADFIQQLDDYVAENLDQNITVEALCDAFRLGRTRLYALSGEYLGCGIADYVRRKKIEAAQKLLRETDMSVSSIAYATGFSDYTHFSRVFKQQCGISARQYRQEQEEKA